MVFIYMFVIFHVTCYEMFYNNAHNMKSFYLPDCEQLKMAVLEEACAVTAFINKGTYHNHNTWNHCNSIFCYSNRWPLLVFILSIHYTGLHSTLPFHLFQFLVFNKLQTRNSLHDILWPSRFLCPSCTFLNSNSHTSIFHTSKLKQHFTHTKAIETIT